MVETLHIAKNRSPNRERSWSIVKRDYNGVEVDYTTLAYLSPEQASALAGGHSGIYLKDGQKTDLPNVAKANILITRVKDRKPMSEAWEFSIGGMPGHRLSDPQIRDLQENAAPLFEAGQPDWESRNVENKLDQIAANRQKIANLMRENAEIMASLTPKGSEPTNVWQVQMTCQVAGDTPEDAAGVMIGAAPAPDDLIAHIYDDIGQLVVVMDGQDLNNLADLEKFDQNISHDI